ncbi:MAG: MFS transporter [Anaerolineae bacterium]|nr:MFS transporter [Anaerolineae bacterium]
MQEHKKGIDRFSLIFILVTAFLNLAGVGLTGPVSPFLVGQYVQDPSQLALANGLLFTSYSLFQFAAVPGLGALSDRYGRRPVLLICLVGSALGYLIFGIGGALWMLFLGRIMDGVTGGNLSAIYAYVADLTEPEQRTRYYGLLGAVSGMGFVIGPAVGGALAKVGGPTAPVYFAAVVTLLNAIWGYFVMPESLTVSRRSESISIRQLNPFSQLTGIFQLPQLRWLLIAILLWALSFAALQSNLSVFTKDKLGWEAADVAVIFTVFGVIGVLVQGGLIRLLLKRFSEVQVAMMGGLSMMTGFFLLSLVAVMPSTALVLIGTAVFAFGNGLFNPSMTGLLSQGVSRREQGRVQGGGQSVQAVGRVLGPLLGSAVYVSIGTGAPYWMGAILFLLATLCIVAAVPVLRAAREAAR